MSDNKFNIQDTIKRLFHKNLIGIKQSFEDEGGLLEDIREIRKVTQVNELKLSVKIGGCEAKSDIYQCKLMGVDGIVAPMIETEFALQKFTEAVSNIANIKFYINIESKTGYENIDKILDSPSSKMLSGVVVGRSDLVKSYGHDKSFVNSDFIFDKTHEIMKKAKSYGLETLMGGNLSPDSFDFISKLKKEELIDYVETRNTIIKVDNISELKDDIISALEFESILLDFKYRKYKEISEEYYSRSETLKQRL
jgi:4-hydroxy-2-oxoheptanedioate aldolase